MTAPETAVRPAWVAELVAAHGEPDVDDGFKLGDRTRRQCAWRASTDRWRLVIVDHTDIATRPWVAAASAPGRRAELVCPTEPTDDEMRALVALGWGGAA